MNYLDPFGLEKWESPFKLQHELFDEWSRNLMIINCLSVVATIIYPPAIVLTSPLMTVTGVIGMFVSSLSLITYFGDAVSAYLEGEDEALATSIDGIAWSFVSLLTAGYGSLSNVHWIYNVIDAVLKKDENEYYRWKEIIYELFE